MYHIVQNLCKKTFTNQLSSSNLPVLFLLTSFDNCLSKQEDNLHNSHYASTIENLYPQKLKIINIMSFPSFSKDETLFLDIEKKCWT